MTDQSTFIRHEACPCGKSSDAVAVYSNGWKTCFSCSPLKHFPPTNDLSSKPEKKEEFVQDKSLTPLTETFRPLQERGLSKETVARYQVLVGGDGSSFVAKYPLFSLDNIHVSNKVRYKEKGFSVEGSHNQAGLFGRQAFPAGSAKFITVVEGQDDAMAVFQMTGRKWPCVSVHSASTALKDVKKDFEYLNSFENIVFCFDNDAAGKKAAKECAGAGFPLGKVKVLFLRKFKDANEYLLNNAGGDFVQEWWQASIYKPDGLKLGKDIWSEIIDRKDAFSVPYPFEGLNRLTFGLRLSELVLLTADTGVGKTSVIKHIEHKLLTNETLKEKGYGVGFLHLEEPNGDTALGLLSIHNGVPYHLPGHDRPEKEIRKAFDELLNNERVVIWDHFGSNSIEAVLDKVRYMAALGCKYIVLDHLSIIVSDQSGDERKQLDEVATKLKTLTMELDIAVIAVIHTNRQGQVRGSAGVEQLANVVLRLERDKSEVDEWRRNVTKIIVEKNRFGSYTGIAGYVYYDINTAKLTELSEVERKEYEAATSRD